MKKYLAFVPFLLLVLVVMSSGCTDTTTVSNSTFNESGVSFNYPSSWTAMTLEEVKNISLSPSSAIGGVQSDDQLVKVVVHRFTAGGMSLSDLKTSMAQVYSSSNISAIKTVDINGKEALVASYVASGYKTKIIVFLVGDYYYSIEMQTYTEDYNDKEAIMNTIQDSIQIS